MKCSSVMTHVGGRVLPRGERKADTKIYKMGEAPVAGEGLGGEEVGPAGGLQCGTVSSLPPPSSSPSGQPWSRPPGGTMALSSLFSALFRPVPGTRQFGVRGRSSKMKQRVQLLIREPGRASEDPSQLSMRFGKH